MAIQLGSIAITVKNMAASLAFYHHLELDIPAGSENESHADATLPSGVRISWDTEALMKDIYPEWETPRGQRITMAFQCETPAAVDALYAKLEAAGYPGHKAPWDAFWGQRYAVAKGPDGELIDLFAEMGQG